MHVKQLLSFAALGTVFGLGSGAGAAAITFSVEGTVSGPTDVINTGTLVEAQYANGNGAGTQTVNGVPFTEGFTSYVGAQSNNVGALAGNSTGNAAYDTVLNGFQADGTSPTVLTLTGLIPTTQYIVELFSLDLRNPIASDRTVNYDDGAGDISPTFSEGSKTIILGAFTANAITQIIDFNEVAEPTNGNLGKSFNAFQVRSVPEPASLGLLALGAAGCLSRRRRA